MDSFFSFFHILDYCYTVCQENDLGGFLGAISPQLWEDSMPIDMAIYNDWSAGCADGDIDEENILKKIYDFLDLYEKQFGYNFSETKKILLEGVPQNVIQKALEQADRDKLKTDD